MTSSMLHSTPQAAPSRPLKSKYVIAVAGNPNCGKTTLFNAMTGLRQKVGNYPGVTVEKREGIVAGDASMRLLDLPGTYSLSARSPDEQIARDVLIGRLRDTPRPDAVLVVVDATNLERNLYLATQVIELGLPTVVACNMMDLLREAGHRLDIEKLSAELGVPVIPTVAHRREGIQPLRAALKRACDDGREAPGRPWRLSDPLEREISAVAERMSASGYLDGTTAQGAALLLLSEGEVPADNHLPRDVRQALANSLERLQENPDADLSLEVTTARYGWIGEVVDRCMTRAEGAAATVTDRLDRVLTHRFWGLTIFGAMMLAVFYSIFSLAEPLMEGIEDGMEAMQGLVHGSLPEGVLRGLLADGVVAGVGNVIVFFPQICILFLAIALLEDTGYMARAAFLMDRIMSRVGLHGKSFIPLLSSHACAIPGIMSARTIENPKDRLTTILVAPLMSCSARLPVYIVLISACLPAATSTKVFTIFSMYTLGIVTALAMATLFKKTLLRGPTPAFIMELPPYRVPRIGAVLRVMWDRSKLFLTRAGTVILAVTIVLWALMSFPISAEREAEFEALRAQAAEEVADEEALNERLAEINNREASEHLRHSVAGRMGRAIEPVIRPLGYDWQIGIAVIASFAAREVFVGSMGVIFAVGDADEESEPLRAQMRAATWPDGSTLFTPLVAVSLMVFYVLACQCVSTIAVVRRETNTWRWPVFMFVYMTLLAYVAAFIVFQVGSALGH